MENAGPVLYVYRCPTCGASGEVHLPDDTHDGAAARCASCGGPVVLEWDGGVALHVTPPARDGSR
ncbi:MAG: hypothetical protein LBV34_13280 [Nocardiopsaceae bacterium]|nr:hypothetical protein [Nocardiopsaceae bacterium]